MSYVKLSQNLDARIEHAIEVVNRYGLQKEYSNEHLKRKIRDTLESKTGVRDKSRRGLACESVYKEIVIDPDMASDLLIASDNYARDNQVSINKATVLLVREIVYAASGGI